VERLISKPQSGRVLGKIPPHFPIAGEVHAAFDHPFSSTYLHDLPFQFSVYSNNTAQSVGSGK
jgi:hypothetical protein